MPTNITGAQGDQSLDCTVNQYNFSGDATQNAGTTTEFVTGSGTPQAITWGGNFTFKTTGTGNIKFTGTSAKRLRLQPSGASTTWNWASAANNFVQATSTGGLTIAYTDFLWSIWAMDQTGGTSSITYSRIFYGRPATDLGDGFFWRPSGGTHTLTNIEVYDCKDTTNGGGSFSITGGTNTIDSLYFFGCGLGILFSTSVAVTVSNLKIAGCRTAISFAGAGAVALTNVSTILNDFATSTTSTPGNGSTITRWMNYGSRRGASATSGITFTPGAGVTITLDECYSGSDGGEGIANLSIADYTRMAVTNSVVSRARASRAYADDGIYYCQGSGNDVVWSGACAGTARKAILGGSSNNDFIAGATNAWHGEIPPRSEGFLSNYADSNLTLTVDSDSGNTASTSTPPQYGTLAINRTNARATPNKPLTVSSIVATPGSNTVNITWTTGVKARSRVLIGTSAGVTRANATSVSPWKYHGILDAELVDFTLPVTSHSHDIALPPGTYYYVPENYDPCGRRFLGAEGSFTIAGETLAITTTSLDDGQINKAYNAEIDSTGGTSPYTYAVTAGALPAGLSLSSGGVISGTPTAVETASFTVTVTDNASATDTQALTIDVNGGGGGAQVGSYAKAPAQVTG